MLSKKGLRGEEKKEIHSPGRACGWWGSKGKTGYFVRGGYRGIVKRFEGESMGRSSCIIGDSIPTKRIKGYPGRLEHVEGRGRR